MKLHVFVGVLALLLLLLEYSHAQGLIILYKIIFSSCLCNSTVTALIPRPLPKQEEGLGTRLSDGGLEMTLSLT